MAGTNALGTFITMLPTFGSGLILFVAIGMVFDRVSKLALFASVLVFKPLVKWGVYAASFIIGVLLLGPVENLSTTRLTPAAGPEIVLRLLVGNLILAILATIIGYIVVYRLAIRYEITDDAEEIEAVLDELTDE